MTPARPRYLQQLWDLHPHGDALPRRIGGQRHGGLAALDVLDAGIILKDVLNYPIPLDQLFQALADPTRRDLIDRLSRGPASVSDLAAPLEMSLPAVLQHLQILESSGLVRSEKVGRVRTCRIETSALRTVEDWISRRRVIWERRLDRLGELLAEDDEKPTSTSRRRS